MNDPQSDSPPSPDDGKTSTPATRGGRRQLSLSRRIAYALGSPLLAGFARLLWATYRIERVIGEDHVAEMINKQQAYVPCYWHRDILVCLMSIRGWIQRGFSTGIIISPSLDGEVPARIAHAWGAEVIRGSAKRTGAMAMRDMRQAMKRGVSIATAADGPVGPALYFKPGVLMSSRIGQAPLVPMGCAASKVWEFSTWDRSRLPKPFARLVIAIGEPVEVPARASAEELETCRRQMENAVNSLCERSKDALANRTT